MDYLYGNRLTVPYPSDYRVSTEAFITSAVSSPAAYVLVASDVSYQLSGYQPRLEDPEEGMLAAMHQLESAGRAKLVYKNDADVNFIFQLVR